MSSTPDRNEPLPISTIHLAASLQFAILLGMSVMGALYEMLFTVRFGALALLTGTLPAGLTVLLPALIGFIVLLVPLLLVLGQVPAGRPALVIGELATCTAALVLAALTLRTPGGVVIMSFAAGYILLGLIVLRALSKPATDQWLRQSVR